MLNAPVKTEEAVDGKQKRVKKEKVPRDPNAPKRPLTAYLLYLETMRPKIQEDLGGEGQKRGDISREGTERWNKLPDSEKEVINYTPCLNWCITKHGARNTRTSTK